MYRTAKRTRLRLLAKKKRKSISPACLDLGCVGDEGGSLINVDLEFRNSGIQERLLVGRQLGQGYDLAHTLASEFDILCKVFQVSPGPEGSRSLLVCMQVDVRRLDQSSLARHGSLEDRQCESRSCV